MKINKIKGLNQFDRQDDDLDVSTFGGFLNSVVRNANWQDHSHHQSHHPHQHHHSPPNTSPTNPPPPEPTIAFRSIDGSGNNETTPTTNSAGSAMTRVGPAHFAGDDGHTPVPNDINPRDISNIVVGEGEAAQANAEGLSGMMYAWGQFIDHDLDLIKSGTDPFNVDVAPGDPTFPDGTTIPIVRAAFADGTGTPDAPAASVNKITGWLDASMVYGSDESTAAGLRTADGHMRTSAGDNLPTTQMPDPAADPTDPNGPAMIDVFMAGDVRAQENPSLTALQTLFVREHNLQVDRLAEAHPDWTGDQLYQTARAIVGAEIAHITYNEFLTHLLGPDWISAYQGYDPSADPTITEEFAGAAYRFGHSLVSDETEKLGEDGNVAGESQLLRDAFFQSPELFAENGGAAGMLRHLGADLSQAMDGRIVEDLRNFLVDPRGAQDLAAINIQRGRDLGLGTLNDTREALGLDRFDSIDDLTDDPGTRAALKLAFGEDGIDRIDLWTGGLSENHAPGAMVGETFKVIISAQFQALRDGDRFWYENQGFDDATLKEINDSSLSDIVMRNTDTQHIQEDLFVYYDRHGGLKSGAESEHPDSPQLVIGSKGFDTLIGGVEGDYLVAATGGKQTMTGNEGGDQFIFGHDMRGIITDFKPGEDKLVFDDAGNLGFRDLKIKADHGNTIVEGNSSQVTLIGVNPYQLHAHDFIYNHDT